MVSTLEVGNSDHHQVQGIASSFATHKREPAGSSIPKRFWNLQNFPAYQQKKKSTPVFVENVSKNDAVCIAMGGSLLPPQCHDVEIDDEYDGNQFNKHGLRRKAAKGLKRIITHFSLSDVNSLSGTPGLTTTTLSHCCHHQSSFHFDQVNEHYMTNVNECNLVSSEETSLDTVSTTTDRLAEFANEGTQENKNALDHQRHHYRSRSHPALLMLNNITSLANRSLPPLPPTKLSMSLNVKNHALDEYHQLKEKMHQAHVDQKLRQAAHWCRKPFHKFMSSPMISTITTSSNPSFSQLMIQDNMEHSRLSLISATSALSLSSSSSLDTNDMSSTTILTPNQVQNATQLPCVQESARANQKPPTACFSKKKVLRCRVIQITNIASSKEYQYELYVQLNDSIQKSQSGILKKVTKGISAASPKESFSFEVAGPFSLAFILCAKPVNSGFSKMKTLISKMDFAHHHHQQQQRQQQQQQGSSISSSVSSCSLQNNNSSSEYSSTMPVVGSTCLLSGEKFEAFCGKGISRYSLIKPLENRNQKQFDELNLELMVAFQLEDSDPWEPTRLSGSFTGEVDFDTALASCHQGDYLTLYTRSKQFPTWNRYWVTLEHGQLTLRQFSNEVLLTHKEPIESIPLCKLQSVCKPGEEIQEQVYFGRKHGIVLKFKTNNIQMDNADLLDDEHLEGCMYLFADSPQKASNWQTVFIAYADTDFSTPNTSINPRYLW